MRILTVAKKRQDRQSIEKALRASEHCPVALFSRGREALVYTQHHELDLVITTRRLQDMDGSSLARAMELQGEGQIPVLMICDQIRQDELIDAIDHGIDNVLLQPFSSEDLNDKVSSLTVPAFSLSFGRVSGNNFGQVREKVSAVSPEARSVSVN